MLEAIERIEQGLRLAPRKLTPAGVLVAEILDDTVASWVAVLRNLIAEAKAIIRSPQLADALRAERRAAFERAMEIVNEVNCLHTPAVTQALYEAIESEMNK